MKNETVTAGIMSIPSLIIAGIAATIAVTSTGSNAAKLRDAEVKILALENDFKTEVDLNNRQNEAIKSIADHVTLNQKANEYLDSRSSSN